MSEDEILWTSMMRRLGGWSAIAGASLLIAAGIGFSGVGREPEAVLQHLSTYPSWYWPAVSIAFVAGAFLVIVAFMGLNSSFRDMRARVLGNVAVVSLLLGAAVYAVNAFASGTALTALAQQWGSVPLDARGDIVRTTGTLLTVFGGPWVGAIILFHGVPFVLSGMAVAYDARYPRPLRWIGVVGGVGSTLTGALTMATPRAVPPALYVAFIGVGLVWMVAVGILLKRPLAFAQRTNEALQVA